MGVNGIYGLSGSGIDVESMVKVGMLSKQKEYDKMQQTYTKNEWTKQAYNEIYTKLTTYSTSTLSPYKLSSNMSAKTAVSSNENAVTATPNGNAVVMSHKVSVEKLSSSPYLVATQSLQKLDPTAETGSVNLQDYLFKTGTYNMVDNVLKVSYADDNALEDVDDNALVDVDVNDVAFEFKFTDGSVDDKGVEKSWTFSYTYGELLGVEQKANGTIKYNENTEKTFNDFISDFNGLGSNIRASYDAVGGKFSFYNKYGGEEAKINFEIPINENREAEANEAIQLTTKTFFQGMKLAQSINGELLARDADGNLVDFYKADGSGVVGDTYYIGSDNAGSGASAALASSAAITYTDDDNNEVTATSDTALTALFDSRGELLNFESGFKFAINGSNTFKIAYQETDETELDGSFVYTKYQTNELDNANGFANLIGADSVSYDEDSEKFTYVRDESVNFNDDDINDLLKNYEPGTLKSAVSYDATTDRFSYEVEYSLEEMENLLGLMNGSLEYHDVEDEDEGIATFTYSRNGKSVTADSETFLNSLTDMLDPDFAATLDFKNFDWQEAWDSTDNTFTVTHQQTRENMAELLGIKSITYDETNEDGPFSYVKSTKTEVTAEQMADMIGAESVNYDSETGKTGKFSYVTAADSGDLSTVGDFINLINSESDTTKVQASLTDGIFSLTSTVKGDNSAVNITSKEDSTTVADFFISAFNLEDANAARYGENDEAEAVEGLVEGLGSKGVASETFSFGITGQYGSATIDGVKFDKLTDNSVTAYGVTYKLHNTTVDDSGKTQTIGIQVEQDTDAIVDRVKSFVEDYNKLLGAIYDKYDEKQYKDYKPLTASQKEQMKDEQIEKWEEKAKSGLLYHDQTLSKIATKMRDAISQPIEGLTGKYTSVYSLGISTTGIHGQLTLDEDKLRAALDADSESVYNVFSTLSKDDTFSENGVAQRLSDVMIDATKLIKERAGTDDSINDDSDLGSLMRQLQNKMSDFKKLLDAFEDKLYKKYDAMEVALSTLGTQLSFITGGQ